MDNQQYTNIMLAIGNLETRMQMGNEALVKEQKSTNDHLQLLNSKVAKNILKISDLEKADITVKNEVRRLANIENQRNENSIWWKRHFGSIMLSFGIGVAILLAKITGIIHIDL